jgi:UDP-2,4-diacetamido-2,4,6-trideoxy-beta-L-altropyranose hydrolase
VVTARLAVFRVDASCTMGTGHLMRCLTLAGGLRRMAFESVFMCRLHDGNLCDLIEKDGFRVMRLPTTETAAASSEHSLHAAWLGCSWEEDAQQCRTVINELTHKPELLVVDHYALDQRWELALRPWVERILVIDDLADRPHDCDVLLDQNLHDAPDSCYAGLVNASTRVLIGPRYALLRPEFSALKPRVRQSGLQRMLVFFGGIDPSGQLMKVVSALHVLGTEALPTVLVLGSHRPNAGQVRIAAEGMPNVSIVDTTNRMAELMFEADLGVGTCGGAAWERCAVGLPALVVVGAENQRNDARLLHELGAVRNLGDVGAVDVDAWVEAIESIRNNPQCLVKMSRAASAILQDHADVVGSLEAALFQ